MQPIKSAGHGIAKESALCCHVEGTDAGIEVREEGQSQSRDEISKRVSVILVRIT